MGWSRDKVAKYKLLRQINKEAWQLIVTTFENAVTSSIDDVVTSVVTTVTFTETLLRDILPLASEQQLELVQSLARGDIQKGKFKTLAEIYRARNEMKAYALTRLGDLGEPFTAWLRAEFDMSRQTVYKFMRVAEMFGSCKLSLQIRNYFGFASNYHL